MIEKKKDGMYNFSDILDTFNKREEAERTGGTGKAGGQGFLVAADSLHIGDGRLEYRDDQTGLDTAVVADGDFKIAPARKVSESLSGELNIKSA
ncbi:MAG: hypothetical protein ACM3MB_11435 [Acidobacteriota bacterium]